MLVLNVCCGDYTEPKKPEKEEPQLVNDISGDTSLADSVKFAYEMSSEADAYYIDTERSAYVMKNTDIRFFCFCCSKILLISGNIFTI